MYWREIREPTRTTWRFTTNTFYWIYACACNYYMVNAKGDHNTMISFYHNNMNMAFKAFPMIGLSPIWVIVIKNASWKVICLTTLRCPFLRDQSWGLYYFLFVLTTSQIVFPLSASYTFMYADDTYLTFASSNINCVDLHLNQDLGPDVRKVDKANQWITQLISLILIQWIVIYPPRAPRRACSQADVLWRT